jgi:hypothetical protein
MSSLGRRFGVLSTCWVMGALMLLPAAAQAAPPSCEDITATTLPGHALTGPSPCTDADGDDFTGFSASPQHGTVTANSVDGTVTYTPDDGFVGHDTFTFTATAGGDTSAPANADILVDTAPACSDSSNTVRSGSSLVISIDDIPCDDADAPPSLDIFIDDPQHGTLTDGPGNAVTYTPNPGFVGTDSFAYSAEDGFGLHSDAATMSIRVTAAPVVTPPPTTSTPPDTTPPTIGIRHPRQKIKNARSKGVTLVETSSEPGTLSVRISVDKQTARKLKIKRNARRAVVVGTLTEEVGAGRTTLHVKLSAKARKVLKRARKVKLQITVTITDAAGNTTSRTLRVTLKR